MTEVEPSAELLMGLTAKELASASPRDREVLLDGLRARVGLVAMLGRDAGLRVYQEEGHRTVFDGAFRVGDKRVRFFARATFHPRTSSNPRFCTQLSRSTAP
jgi:hypothetical protein